MSIDMLYTSILIICLLLVVSLCICIFVIPSIAEKHLSADLEVMGKQTARCESYLRETGKTHNCETCPFRLTPYSKVSCYLEEAKNKILAKEGNNKK